MPSVRPEDPQEDPRIANAYRKVDEMLFYWLSLPETTRLVNSYIETELKNKGHGLLALKDVSTKGGPVKSIDRPARSSSSSSTSPGSSVRSTFGKSTFPKIVGRSRRSPSSLRGETGEPSWRKSRQLPFFYDPGQVKISMIWTGSPEGLSRPKFMPVTKVLCGFPGFFNSLLFDRIILLFGDGSDSVSNSEYIKEAQFCAFWKAEMEPFDYVDRLFRLLKQPESNYIYCEDFEPPMHELLGYHPGLEFLESHVDFHLKYITTVITRIFYAVNRARNGRISSKELRRSNLMEVLQMVDEEEDINKIMHYFNYEHFYFIFCQFYELDTDRKSSLNRDQLMRHGEHGLSSIIVNRIFEVGHRPFVDPESKRDVNSMSYEDYIYFLLSEEDKANEHSLKYWFTCCDVDGDGKLSHMDMKIFYDLQMHRMESLGHEIVSYGDMICQMMDVLHIEAGRDYILIEDLLQPYAISMVGNLFNALFNLNKFVGFEQRDPFLEASKRTDQFLTAWDRHASNAYLQLAAQDEEADDDFSSQWDNTGSCQYQYSDYDTDDCDEDSISI